MLVLWSATFTMRNLSPLALKCSPFLVIECCPNCLVEPPFLLDPVGRVGRIINSLTPNHKTVLLCLKGTTVFTTLINLCLEEVGPKHADAYQLRSLPFWNTDCPLPFCLSSLSSRWFSDSLQEVNRCCRSLQWRTIWKEELVYCSGHLMVDKEWLYFYMQVCN